MDIIETIFKKVFSCFSNNDNGYSSPPSVPSRATVYGRRANYDSLRFPPARDGRLRRVGEVFPGSVGSMRQVWDDKKYKPPIDKLEAFWGLFKEEFLNFPE